MTPKLKAKISSGNIRQYIHTRNAFNYSLIRTIEFLADSELKTIEDYAFFRSKIDEFEIPPHVTSIGNYAFGESSLYKVKIPENTLLQTIGEYAFQGTSIKSFTIPATVTEIMEGIFAETNYIKEIKVCPENR